jgi:hypothetical protein
VTRYVGSHMHASYEKSVIILGSIDTTCGSIPKTGPRAAPTALIIIRVHFMQYVLEKTREP